jgi:hypothetical protein
MNEVGSIKEKRFILGFAETGNKDSQDCTVSIVKEDGHGHSR